MGGTWRVWRWVALIAAMTLWAAAGHLEAQSQAFDDLVALRDQVSQLQSQGKYAEAVTIAERYVDLAREHHGEDDLEYGTAIDWLASCYLNLGRYAEAEPLYKRALEITEKTLGPENLDVAAALNNLGSLYLNQGRYAEAEPLFKRGVVIIEQELGPDHLDTGNALNNLAELYGRQGRYAEAGPLYERSLTIRENALGPDHPDIAISLNNLGAHYRDQGRYADAEPLFQRSLAIREKALGLDHPKLVTALNNLASVYHIQGRYSEAEPLFQRSIAIGEKALGPEHYELGDALAYLGVLYSLQGRYAPAEPLLKRALTILEKALGGDHVHVAVRLSDLAQLYYAQGRLADAEPLFQRSMAIHEKALGAEHPEVAHALNNLAEVYRSQERVAEAEPLLQRSLAIYRKALGGDHHHVATALHNVAGLYATQGRYAEAEPIYQQSLAITEKALGPDHSKVGATLNNIADMNFAQQRWAAAAEYWRRSTALIIRRAQRGTSDVGQAVTGKKKSESEQLSYQFKLLIKTVHRLPSDGRGAEIERFREMFQTAQWAQNSEAAASLAQMAARGAKGGALAALVRERQDLVEEWQRLDGMRVSAVSQVPEHRDRAAEAANAGRLATVATRISAIDASMLAEFPDYTALTRPTPLPVEEVQARLRANEALVLFLDTRGSEIAAEETFVWVVTKTAVRWVKSDWGRAALVREVAALRCGLDAAAWEVEGTHKCGDLVATDSNSPVTFDIVRAHRLYKSLFGQIEDLIRGKHLLIVPSGPLAQLPFQVLVTAAPAKSDYKSAAWLVRAHAITVLPAVSSLKALRRIAKASNASKPMIGVGNPLLDGNPAERPWEAEWAKLAREKQVCEHLRRQQVAGRIEKLRGVRTVAMRGGRADLDLLRSQAPLHDTTNELCAVAKDLRVTSNDILLGARATEANIKKLSSESKLGTYRVVHFATHGVMAGELEADSEPGLILTPPTEQSELDDGYLSASEVSSLKLDADWVILSACNTAAGGSDRAEALSGLARAFFYSGARSLLVSHWAVNSAATVKLITTAVGATARDKKLGRAEALRRAMLAMIDKGELEEAHPSSWAPFVLVGEGAAAK